MYPPKPTRIYEDDILHRECIADDVWICEPKLNGYRGIYRDGALYTRQKKRMPGCSAAVLTALAAIPEGVVLDGELMNPHGRQTFHVFDCPTAAGNLEERRAFIESLTFCYPVVLMPWIPKARATMTARSEGWEGVVFKRRDSEYQWQATCKAPRDVISQWRKIRLP